MPEWHKIRSAISNGAANTRDLADLFDVAPGTISAALRRMPDGQEQRKLMKDNTPSQPASAFPPRRPEAEMPDEAAEQLRAFAPHYDDYPVPKELAVLTARLLYIGVTMGAIAKVTGCPFYVVQGWAAQAGYFTQATLARHAEIREAIDCGAESLQDVADLTGLARERVRQLSYSMPDREIVYRKLNVRLRRPNPAPLEPEPVQEAISVPEPLPGPRTLTNRELLRLLQVIERARNVPRNGTPQQRRLLIIRDQYVQKLHHQEGISIAELAEASGENNAVIRDWASPAKSYRRQLKTQAIARAQRAKRRS